MNANTHQHSPFEVLGVPENATAEEIKAAHKTLAKHWHPDRNHASNAAEMMKELNWALEMALNPGEWKAEQARNARTEENTQDEKNYNEDHSKVEKEFEDEMFRMMNAFGDRYAKGIFETFTHPWEMPAFNRAQFRYMQAFANREEERAKEYRSKRANQTGGTIVFGDTELNFKPTNYEGSGSTPGWGFVGLAGFYTMIFVIVYITYIFH